MRIVTKIGVVCILLGTIALAGPTFGFTTFSADRGASVNVTADDTAYLGIEESYNDQTITSGDAQPLIRLTNQFSEELGGTSGTISVEVAEVTGDIEDNNSLAVDSAPTQLDPDEAGNVDVICTDDTINGKKTVDVTLRIIEASGQAVSVTDKTVDPVTNVEVKCSDTTQTQSGLTDVWASDITDNKTDTNQDIKFTLTNDLAQGEAVEVDLSDANKVDYSAATISIQDDNGNGAIEVTDNSGKKRQFEYVADGGTVPNGTAVTIEITGIDTTDNNANGTYDAVFQKDGEPDSTTVTFTVE